MDSYNPRVGHSLKPALWAACAGAIGSDVQGVWKQIPRPQKQNIDLMECYYLSLIRTNLHEQAEKDIAAEVNPFEP